MTMTPKIMGFLALMPMLLLLLIASLQDIRSHRISNKLVLIGIVVGVSLNMLLPEGWGFNSAIPGGLGWQGALKGFGVGMAVFLPIYLLRAMGAGDVKLMAMVGTFLGPEGVLGAILATFVAGGVMALALVLWSKQLMNLFSNVRMMLTGGLINVSVGKLPVMDDAPVSVGKLPYGVAIAVGTLGYLIWQRM